MKHCKFILSLLMIFLITGCRKKEFSPDIILEEKTDIQLIEANRYFLPEHSNMTDIISYKNQLILSDYENQKITFMDLNGNVMKEITSEIIGLESFEPTALSCQDNQLYILDNFTKRIIVYDLDSENYEIIKIPQLENVAISSFLSIANLNDKIFISFSVYHDSMNNLYEVNQKGEISKKLNSFMGYLNVVDEKLYATKAFIFEQEDKYFNISNKEATIYLFDSNNQLLEYKLESQLAPHKLHQWNENFISSCLGIAGIVQFDLVNQQSKIIYLLPYEDISSVKIGELAIGSNHHIYLLDKGNNQLIELVQDDSKNVN